MSSINIVAANNRSDDIGANSKKVESLFYHWFNKGIANNPNLVSKINNIYKFNITRNGNITSVFILDLTDGNGTLYKDSTKDAKCTITIDENDLLTAFDDPNHLKVLFLSRKMKLLGTRVHLEKLQQFWVEMNNSVKPDDENRKLLDSIPCDGLKSDIIFTALRTRMSDEPDIVSKLRGVTQFHITRDKNTISTWTIDFNRQIGENVYRGEAMHQKPDCIVTFDDEDFYRMMSNKTNPQKLFMLGKVNAKGNIMAVYRLFTVWIDTAYKKAKAPELEYFSQILDNTQLISGLKSETVLFELVTRLVKQPQLCQLINAIYYFNITKNNQLVSKWRLDLKNKMCGIFSRSALNNEETGDAVITIDDNDFVLLAYNRLSVEQAFLSKRIDADICLSPNISLIFKWPLIGSKL